MKATKIVLQNKEGQTVRTLNWDQDKIFVIWRKDTGRVEFHANLSHLEDYLYEVLSETSVEQIRKAPVAIGDFGTLKEVDEIESVSPSVPLPEDNSHRYNAVLKWTAISHVIVLAIILMMGSVIQPALEEKPEVVIVTPQQRPEPRRTVNVSEQKIDRTKKVAERKVTPKKSVPQPKPVAQKRPNNNQRSNVRREVNVQQTGALGALGGNRQGSQNSSGLNLQATNNSRGSGRSGSGGAGGMRQALPGQGLVGAPVGSGRAEGAGGYSTRGQGGGQPGYGNHSMAGSSAAYSQPLAEEALVEGGLDRDQIAAVINRHIGQVIYCYEQGLQTQPSLAGRVAVRFVIGGNGQVSTARVANSSLRSQSVEGCIVQRLRGWKFPEPHGNVNVRVTYPFVLKRVSQG